MIQRLNEGILGSVSAALVSLSLVSTPFISGVFPLVSSAELDTVTEQERVFLKEHVAVQRSYEPIAHFFGSQQGADGQFVDSPPSAALESFLREEQDRIASMPERVNDSVGPVVSAESVVVLDRASGAILFEKQSDRVRPMASLTKLMTALVVSEEADLNGDVVMTASADAVSGSSVQLSQGSRVNARDLVTGMLVASGNDAAYQLAEYTSGSQEAFIERMNERAQELGMTRTAFVNPYGLHEDGHVSTALDIAQLLHVVWGNDVAQEALQLKRFSLPASTGTQDLRTTNELQRDEYPGLLGGKTGFTDEAGYCLAVVGAAPTGQEIVVVLMGSISTENRWEDMKSLLSWTYQTYRWKN